MVLCASLCLFLIHLLPATLSAATPYTPIQPDPLSESYRWRTFPEINGRGLRCLDEDTQGNMWFGVDEGAVEYDGITWKTHTPDDGILGAPVNFLCTTRDGSVYTGTDLGISQFKGGIWKRVFPPEGDLPWFVNNLLETSDGNLWAASEWGALNWDGSTWKLYTASDIATSLRTLAPYIHTIVVPDELITPQSWAESTGVFITSGPFLGINRSDVLPVVALKAPDSPVKNLNIGDRVIGGSGYLGSELIPVALVKESVIQPGNKTLEMSSVPSPLSGSFRIFSIYDIYEDRDNRLWFTRTHPQGTDLFLLDISEGHGSWQTFTASDGFSSGYGSRILQAQDETIWIINASAGNGINRFDGKTWTHTKLSAMGGSDLSTSILQTEEGTVWIASFGYLDAFQNNRWEHYRLTELPWHRPRLLEASDGALWIAGLGGEAARLDFSQWATYESLNFGGETSDGRQWFVHEEGGVVQYNGKTWTRYGTEDGLMDTPMNLMVTQKDEILVGGSHDSTAAMARFDGQRWTRQIFPQLSWGIFPRNAYEANDGTVWFSGSVDNFMERGHIGGLLEYNGQTWIYHKPPSVLSTTYAIGQGPDNTLYFGRENLRRFTEETSVAVEEIDTWVMSMWTDPGKALWVGTRLEGVYHFNGQTWRNYTVQDGLADNYIKNIFRDSRGILWIDTNKGLGHFDGRTFTANALPAEVTSDRQGTIKESRDGALWINSMTVNWARKSRPGSNTTGSDGLRTVRYMPNPQPPETQITLSLDEVAQPGNTTLTWTGTDRWHATSSDKLQYAYRLDNGAWSAFSNATQKTLLALPSGNHTFAVKARDLDLNEDPSPDVIHFTVIPPVYQQAWFLSLMVVMFSAIAFQTTRVIRRDRRLQESNSALSTANKDLFRANLEIQQQSERKSTFLASMSHELRTPMNAIKGFTNLVLRRAESLSDRNRENLEKVTQASDHLLAMINDLLDLSKIEAGRMDVTVSTFDIEKLVASCVSTVSPLIQDDVALSYEIQSGIGEVHTDEARLRQMLINLTSNAIKFTDSGRIEVKARHEGDLLVLSVSDTGKGIPRDELPTIFDEYRQVEGSESRVQKGTGLGLSITRKFAELLGGSIGVESEEGKGSVFTVKIPLAYTQEV